MIWAFVVASRGASRPSAPTASHPHPLGATGSIEITVKREDHGLVSRWLHDEVKVGDEIEIEAPNGIFFFTGEQAESVVLIGGGVGITPIMSAVRYLTDTNWSGKIYLIL